MGLGTQRVTGGEGAEIVYSLKNNSTLADLALEYIGDAGQIKRKVYQRRLPENPNKDYYYILRESGNTEPILVEYGFIDNVNDANKLKNNLTDYVEGVVKALAEYTGYTYYPPNNNGINQNEYIVKKGDTLYSIAQRFNIKIDELKRINNLTSNTLYIGQILKLGEEPNIETDIYTIKNGDTLYSIAQRYNISLDELKKLNNLTSNNIYIGQKILVPLTENEENDYIIYVVEKGDSLWLIAKKFGIPVTELIEINNLDNLVLQIGQELLVPNNQIDENDKVDKTEYIVKKGDTLWSVAKEYNLSVDELKKLNNLKNNLLSVGQVLKVK